VALRLLFLGRLRDSAGGEAREVAANPGETVAALIDRLEPALADAVRLPKVRVAVNGAVLGDMAATRLADGDEIAFLPPVSGG
jgi:sulfur-carrier protein